MAGPSVVVRVLADLKGLAGGFKDAGSQAEQSSGRMREAFGGVLANLNRTGVLGPFGDALTSIGDTLDGLHKKGVDAGLAMVGIGGAVAGVGYGLTILGSKDQAARQQLAASIEATGNAWDDYASKVESAIKHNERFGDTADKTENALQILTQATGNPQTALNLLSVATDLAAAKHEDLSTAATQLGKIYNGNTKLLQQFGIVVASSAKATGAADTATRLAATADARLADTKRRLVDLETIDAAKKKLTVTQAVRLRDAEQNVTTATNNAVTAHRNLNAAQQTASATTKDHATAIDQLAQKVGGQAGAQADTAVGRIKGFTTALEDQAAALGTKYGPALQVAGQGVAVLGAAWTGAKALHEKFKGSVDAGAKTSEETGKKAGLLSRAVKSLGGAFVAAGAYIIEALLGITATVAIVIGIILALIVIGYIVYRNWSTIWAGMKLAVTQVFDWLKRNWPLIVGILLGPFGLVAYAIYHWWDAILGFFEKLPGRIAAIAGDIWRPIWDAFKWVINHVIDGWNWLSDHSFIRIHEGLGPLPDLNISTPRLIPRIPSLAAGGLITQTGLIFAHAGEAITPAGRTGPAVVINDAHFASEVDVELFMRRAAWVVQTARI